MEDERKSIINASKQKEKPANPEGSRKYITCNTIEEGTCCKICRISELLTQMDESSTGRY